MKDKTISVFGYGRFGRFWAGILAEDFKVKVYSRHGIKEDEIGAGMTIVDEDEIFNCDALFFCVSISSFEDVLKKNSSRVKENTIIFDTCSVKTLPVRWMKENVPDSCQIVATHPMFGPDSYHTSKEDMPIVMCWVNSTIEEFNLWKDYFNNKPMQVIEMSVEDHDKKAAYSQGITHYIGRVLADLNLTSGRIDTLGYKKLLDIIEQTCHDDWQLFLDLQKFNPYTENMRKDLYKSIRKIYGIFTEDEN